MKINEIFEEQDFKILKVIYKNNSPIRDVIVKVNGYEYEISYENLRRFLLKFDICIETELKYCNVERIDTRPLFRKAMDFDMGRKVDFKRPKNYRTIDSCFLENNLKTYERN